MDTSMWIILASICVSIVTSQVNVDPFSGGHDAPGRIKEFDQLLIEHGKSITKGEKLKRLTRELKEMAKELDYDPEMEQYYLEVISIIDGVGGDALKDERDRLNSIITSLSGRSKAEVEIDYSVKRRNIIEAFVDASAQYVMGTMDMPGMFANFNPNADNNFQRDDF